MKPKSRYKFFLTLMRVHMVMAFFNLGVAVLAIIAGVESKDALASALLFAIMWFLSADACEKIQVFYRLDNNGDPIKEKDDGPPAS